MEPDERETAGHNRRLHFERSACDRHPLHVAPGTGHRALLQLRTRLAELMGGSRRGALKVCRRRDGKRTAVLHVRLSDEEGLLAPKHCQFCGTSAACSHSGPGAAGAPLPWAAFDTRPFCEYCGTRLEHSNRCGKCATAELPVTISEVAADRPVAAVEEERRGQRVQYTLHNAPLRERFDVQDPGTLPLPEPKPAELPPMLPGVAGGGGGETSWKFEKRTAKDCLDAVLRIMREQPDKLWGLRHLATVTYEPEQAVRGALGQIADKEGSFWRLKPQYQ